MDYKIEKITKNDEPLVNQFLRDNFYTSEPLNVAFRAKFNATESLAANSNFENIANGLSLKAVDGDGNILGVSLNTCPLEGRHIIVRKEIEGRREIMEEIIKFLGLIDELSGVEKLIEKHHQSVLDVKILSVDAKHRQKGIGARLIEETIKTAEAHDIKAITVGCSSYYTSVIVQHKFPNQFRRVLTYPYSKYVDSNGEVVFKSAEPHVEYHVYFYER
ncbi:dopamine N-acetyltransferase-like isoform X2 [Diaphorina citri]|uniref:Dopamine N-acetyltransferase-like isoform X1 n=1 Tax=Diaphorina citri TaxID=121845 RepID=A0A3Q0IUH9_DIACI|nr:dopamine N-acetyltransferase-like isoform X1 [Diaphorina citri]XP_026678313.1 dopamine N-acetyltransferase-like isoform X2 [Diaphorina citri]